MDKGLNEAELQIDELYGLVSSRIVHQAGLEYPVPE
jgi:hypothetical protein